MADFDPDSFLATKPSPAGFDPDTFLKGGVSNPAAVAPSSEEMLRQKEAVDLRNQVRKEKQKFVDDNQRPGIPLLVENELPSGLRARASFESNPDKQLELIQKRPDVLGARKSKDGRNIIVAVSGENGKEQDVLLHPMTSTLTAGDIAVATAPILKTGAITGAALATGGMSLLPTAGVLAATAGGAEALSSGVSRLAAGQNIDPKELALASTKEAAINAALPLVAKAGPIAANFARNAFTRGTGELERQLPLAASRLGVEPTAAEITGSSALAKIGRLTPAEEAERQARLGASKDRAFGLSGTSTVPSEEAVTNKVQPIFSEVEQTAKAGVTNAMSDAQKAAQQQIQASIDAGQVPTNHTTSEVGDFIREKIAGKAADSKTTQLRTGAEKLYGEANRLAEAEGIEVTPTNVSKLRQKLDNDTHQALLDFAPGIKKIPALDALLNQETVTDTGLVDAAGRAIQSVSKPPPMSVQQARELRSVVYDMAHSPGAPGEGGVPRRYLTQLYKALDNDLESVIASGSDDLKAAHKVADDFYKSKIQPLQQSDVAKLFLENDAAGRMGGDEIVRRLFRGDGNLDALRAYRDVLGEKSPEWKLLVRQGLQTVAEDAGARSGKIDAGILLNRINQLGKTELADEIIGPVAKALRADATLMSRAQGVKIPEDELADALAASPSKAAMLLKNAITRESEYDRAYNSGIQQQLRNGVLGPRTIGNVDDFLTRFINGGNTSVSEVRQALTQIGAKSPQTVEDIRQRTLKNILDQAGATPPLGKVTTGEVKDISHDSIVDLLKGNGREKYQAILGKDGVQFLDDLATYAEATAKRQAGEQGRKVAPETLLKEGASGAIGFKRNAIGALVDVGSATARALGGGAIVKNPAVVEFLKTGVLPTFDRVLGGPLTKSGTALLRAPVLAAPQAERTRESILSEKKPLP